MVIQNHPKSAHRVMVIIFGKLHFQLPALISKLPSFQHVLAPRTSSPATNSAGKIKAFPTRNVTIWSCPLEMRNTQAAALIIQVKD